MTRLLPLALALLLAPAPCRGEETVSFRITPPAGKLRLAEVFRVKVEASYPEKYSISPDTASLAGEDFGLTGWSASSPKAAGALKTQTFDLKVQGFALGISTFPAMGWKLSAPGAEPAEARSPSFVVELLAPFEKSDANEIRDIYPPFRYTPWGWLLGGLLAAAGAAWLYNRQRRGPAGFAAAAWRDPRPPYRRALDRLSGIKGSPLAAAGRLKEYYIGLTAVLRLYLAEEFSISADLMTTSDLARELKRTGADLKTTLKTREFLQKADLVKFAKFVPADAEKDAAGLESLLADFNAAAEKARAAALAAAAAAQAARGGKP
jgi:hypothetical protein